MKKAYALILQPNVPQELLALLDGYTHSLPPSLYVLSETLEPTMHFVCIEAIPVSKAEPWPMQIPIPYILAIVDMSEKRDVGFQRQER